MEYDINLLAEEYLNFLSNTEIETKKFEIPSFDKSAYTDNEYLNLIYKLNLDFDKVNDIHTTEQFLNKN